MKKQKSIQLSIRCASNAEREEIRKLAKIEAAKRDLRQAEILLLAMKEFVKKNIGWTHIVDLTAEDTNKDFVSIMPLKNKGESDERNNNA